jgi:hypothetical protein
MRKLQLGKVDEWRSMPTQDTIRERPILMSAPMVRAILAGRKTQTRRVLRKQPIDIIPCPNPKRPDGKTWITLETRNPNHGRIIGCRFGVPGDRLWVRESFSYYHDLDGLHPVYMADTQDHGGNPPPHDKWHPSIHMPRWASRITLEVTAVRVERLQDIRTQDIIAEGILEDEHYLGAANRYRHPFQELWDAINAKRGYGWESNPYVWVVSFKRVL